MTTYVLHGGATREDNPSNRAFFQLMADYVPEGGIWLGCYFARLPEVSTDKFEEDAVRVQGIARKGIRCVMAAPDTFMEQVAQADVLYIAGGMTKTLKEHLLAYSNIRDVLARVPVVAGSSAGMNMLGNQYVSKDKTVGNGLGLVPFNMLVHHKSAAYAEPHESVTFTGPTLALQETNFCVVEM